MQHPKLTYRFHDPNPPGVAAEYILKICMEANISKVEQAIREAMEETERATEVVKPDKPETLEWEKVSSEAEPLNWKTEPEEKEEIEPEKCPSQGWAMTMM